MSPVRWEVQVRPRAGTRWLMSLNPTQSEQRLTQPSGSGLGACTPPHLNFYLWGDKGRMRLPHYTPAMGKGGDGARDGVGNNTKAEERSPRVASRWDASIQLSPLPALLPLAQSPRACSPVPVLDPQHPTLHPDQPCSRVQPCSA